MTRGRVVEAKAAQTLTVEDYARRWLEEFIDTAIGIDGYRRDVQRYIIPCLGEHHLAEVSSLDIAVLLNRASAESSVGMAASVKATCQTLFADAVKDGLLTRSPAED